MLFMIGQQNGLAKANPLSMHNNSLIRPAGFRRRASRLWW
jgi:hypothetical protein